MSYFSDLALTATLGEAREDARLDAMDGPIAGRGHGVCRVCINAGEATALR